jgi:DNA transposition AAA+ family ATPase
MQNQQITNELKKEIQTAVSIYVQSFPSQKAAAESLNDVSEAILIQVKNNEWAKIADKMWRNIAKQLGVGKRKMVLVETLDFDTMILMFSTSKQEGATFAIMGQAGSGKTTVSKWYEDMNRLNNVFRLECAEYWNKKTFLQKLLQRMGKSFSGMNTIEMMEAVVREMRKLHQPLLILDEIDKLGDPVFKFFITLYNELNGECGFIWLSTDNIEKRMRKGLNTNRNGYQELWSRIGSRFIQLHGTTAKEVTAICKANNITDPEEVNMIINESNGDLRRVERNFLKKKLQQNRKNLKAA